MVQKNWIVIAIVICWGCASASPPRPSLLTSTRAVLTDSVRALALDGARVWACDSVDDLPELLDIPEVEKAWGGDHYQASSTTAEASRVTVRFVIDQEGKPEQSSVRAIPPFDPRRAQAAMHAVVESRFRPARVGGRPVRVVVNLPFDFPPGW